MNNFSFQNLSALLRTGHEIEFVYKGKSYSITNSQGFWHLCVDTSTESILVETICLFEELDLLPNKVANICIDGVKILHIFDNSLFELSSLQIL